MGEWVFPPDGGRMEKAEGLYLQTMNMTQIRERLKTNDLIIIPVGSTECHGAGQPLGEDTFLVTRMAEQVALKTGCTIAEPVWYGSILPITWVCPVPLLCRKMRFGKPAGYYRRLVEHGFSQANLSEWAWAGGSHSACPAAIRKKYQVPAVLISLHWPTVIHDYLKDKAHGGPFETPFQHADEAEGSYSLALFPEFMDMSLVVDTKPKAFCRRTRGQRRRGVSRPIKGHEHVGLGGAEVLVYPEGVIGRPTLADAEKAKPGLNALLDYMVRLIGISMTKFPAGTAPLKKSPCGPRSK